jgi:hypothetical protein
MVAFVNLSVVSSRNAKVACALFLIATQQVAMVETAESTVSSQEYKSH